MTALLIILGIILFFIAVLSIPFNVYADYNEEFTLYIRYLFIKYYIYPPAEKKKKEKKEKPEKEKPEEEKPEAPKEKSDNFIKTFYNDQGLSGILELISNIAAKLKKGLYGITRSFYIRRLWLRINVAGKDSADAAEKYGKMCARVYPPMGYIINSMHSKRCSVKINPDFLGKKSQGAFKLHLAIIPSKLLGSVIALGLRLAVELIKIFISNSKASAKSKSNQSAASKEAAKDNLESAVTSQEETEKKGGKTQ